MRSRQDGRRGRLGAHLAQATKSWRRAPEVLACVRQIIEWRRVTLAYLGLRVSRYPFVIHFRSGDQIEVESYHDLVTVWVVFLRQEYQVSDHFRSIVDAGANIGTFTLYAARRAPSALIHAIEPFPTTRKRLLKTIRDNGLETRVKVHPVGLASCDSPRYMSPAGPSQSRGTTSEPGPDKMEVETTTLARFVDEARVGDSSLLKVDIEGAEHEVIGTSSCATLRRFGEIAIEYHSNGSRQRLFDKLEDSGFVCKHDRRDHENSGVAQFVRKS